MSSDILQADGEDSMCSEIINANYNPPSKDVLIELISESLNQLIKDIDQITDFSVKNEFFATQKPAISIIDYLKRIQRFTQCSQICLILAIIYIDRVQERNQIFILNSMTIHRFLLISISTAMKFFQDKYYKNEYYAQVGGIPLDQFNILEEQFLQMFDFQLHVLPQTFHQYLSIIVKGNDELDEEQNEPEYYSHNYTHSNYSSIANAKSPRHTLDCDINLKFHQPIINDF